MPNIMGRKVIENLYSKVRNDSRIRQIKKELSDYFT